MRSLSFNVLAVGLSALAMLGASDLWAQAQAPDSPPGPEPAQAAALHPWQAALPRLTAEAYFTNLKNGDQIETPFLVKFGLSGGWGLAPVAKPSKGKGGHHHLLVNRDLPLDFKQPLPFTDQYIHFGKGQMETVLTLAPGEYTLRLLLADNGHLPHFVYSKPMNITVTKKNATDPKSLVKKGISLMVTGDELKPPFRVQFHASGLNVAQTGQKEPETGHFRLSVVPKSGAAAELDFTNGQTEVWLAPPAGDYSLKLEFVDNLNAGKTLAGAVARSVRVQ